MAGRGPVPKPDSVRRRRNVATSAAVLPSQKNMRARWKGRKLPSHMRLPDRPDGEAWEDRTVAWWRDVMRSPQATRYLDADLGGLYIAFVLIDEFYKIAALDRLTKGRLAQMGKLASEIRQQIARYGLTPRDRLSLHWGVTPDEEDEGPKRGPAPVTKMQDYRGSLGEGEAPA